MNRIVLFCISPLLLAGCTPKPSITPVSAPVVAILVHAVSVSPAVLAVQSHLLYRQAETALAKKDKVRAVSLLKQLSKTPTLEPESRAFCLQQISLLTQSKAAVVGKPVPAVVKPQKLLFLILTALLGLSPVQAQPSVEKEVFTAPFALDGITSGCPLVRVSLNGSRPLLFLLDTGDSSPISLLPWTAKQLNISLPTDGSSLRLNKRLINACEIQGKNSTSFSLSVPYINFLPTSPIEGFGTEPVAGHIGLPALLGTRMTLDFATKELTLRTKAQLFTPKSDTTVFPLKAIDDPLRIEGVEVKLGMRRVSIATTVGVEAVRHPVNLIVDTGSDLTHIPRTVLTSLEPYRIGEAFNKITSFNHCLLYTSPSPRD